MSNFVPPSGPRDARIALVGEAPGRQESIQGRPFVGAAGNLLDFLLSKAGLSRSELYITNVIKEQPPRNNVKKFIDKKGRNVITTSAYDDYVEYLQKELTANDPNLILAAGNVSLYALTGLWGITAWRGSVLPSTLIPGKKVLPIIHPASALYQYVQRWVILFDLKKAKQHAETPLLPLDLSNYILEPSFSEAVGYLNRVLESNFVAYDIETSHGQLDCISFSINPNEAISIPHYNGNKEYWTLEQEAQLVRLYAEILERSDISKLAHNAIFDSSFLLRKYGIKATNLHDTMIAQRILFPDFLARLAFVTSTYTDIPYYKEDGKELIHNKLGSNRTFWLYNAKDSIVLMKAWPKMEQDLRRQGNWSTYDDQRRLIEPLNFINYRGILMDKPALRRASEDAALRIEKIREEINELVGREINPGSPKQVADFFYKECKLKPYYTKNAHGNQVVTTNESALIRIKTKQHPKASPVADLILQDRKLSKRNGTYYKVKLSPDGRLRCSMNPVGTRMGRLSSSKSKIDGLGANLQNQPWDMKRMMLVDPGCVVYEIDLAQAENRVVAYAAEEKTMIRAFEDGRDIHAQTAALIFNIPYDEVSDEKNSAGISDWSQRDAGKKGNHAFNYGMREHKASLQWEVPYAHAKLVSDQYHRGYPGIRRWHARIEEQLRKNRTLENLFGRRYTFWKRLDDNATLLEAYAFIAQSTVADIINRWGVIPLYNDQATFGAAELLIQIHDSLTIQIPLCESWGEHARILLALRESLERPLHIHDYEFIIPAEIKLKTHNFFDGEKVPNLDERSDLAQALTRLYSQQMEEPQCQLKKASSTSNT